MARCGQVTVPGQRRRGPRRWGRHFPAAASAPAPRALRFGKSLFSSAGRAGVSVLKTRTKIHWLVFPALALPPSAARLLEVPNLQHFRAWLKHSSVIWCRGRSPPDSAPSPLTLLSPDSRSGCCRTFFLQFLQRESSLPYFLQPVKLRIVCLFARTYPRQLRGWTLTEGLSWEPCGSRASPGLRGASRGPGVGGEGARREWARGPAW